jgi:hypothetical protein
MARRSAANSSTSFVILSTLSPPFEGRTPDSFTPMFWGPLLPQSLARHPWQPRRRATGSRSSCPPERSGGGRPKDENLRDLQTVVDALERPQVSKIGTISPIPPLPWLLGPFSRACVALIFGLGLVFSFCSGFYFSKVAGGEARRAEGGAAPLPLAFGFLSVFHFSTEKTALLQDSLNYRTTTGIYRRAGPILRKSGTDSS